MRIRQFIVRILGGFVDAEEAIASVTDDKEKQRLLTLATKHLFNTISQEDILQPQGQTWMFENRPLSLGEKNLLVAEATQFLRSKLWRVLQKDVKWKANEAMYIKGKSSDDLVAGKLWLYILDCFETRLNSMSKESALLNTK